MRKYNILLEKLNLKFQRREPFTIHSISNECEMSKGYVRKLINSISKRKIRRSKISESITYRIKKPVDDIDIRNYLTIINNEWILRSQRNRYGLNNVQIVQPVQEILDPQIEGVLP